MKLWSNNGKNSLYVKIVTAMLGIILLMMVLFFSTVAFSMFNIYKSAMDSNMEMTESVTVASAEFMMNERLQQLSQQALNKADTVDRLFLAYQIAVRSAASYAEKLLDAPNAYQNVSIPLPDAANDGKLAVQTLYADYADPGNAALRRELLLMGNIGDVLTSINENYPSIVSNYYSSELGFTVMADYISASKFDENGVLMPLNADERPWYVGAKETGEPFFTSVTKDYHTNHMAIMCGVPVYHDGTLMGVCGAGIYLDSVQDLVEAVDLDEYEDACIMDRDGRIVFSSFEIGSLAAKNDGEDIRGTVNRGLAKAARDAADGKSGVSYVTVNGEAKYVAYTPLPTVGWSLMIYVSAEEIYAPTMRLEALLKEMTAQTSANSKEQAINSLVTLACVVVAGIIMVLLSSLKLSRRIVEPIQQLTDSVSELEGDNLKFDLELHTGDETQTLAESFKSLTERMQTYVDDIQTITADRERVQAELDLAAKIQADVLPMDFPAFPDRNEFDLYASMEAAREVGGDFYDFFLMDDDHLVLSIADVSGKGIPASLYMMLSKATLANTAKLGLSPAKILEASNNAICDNNQEEMFVTAWVGILEISTGRLTAANAGHEYPVIRRPGGDYELLKDKHGFVLGGFPDETYEEYEVQLEPGSKLFVYTDGLPEANNETRELFGIDRMLETLNKCKDLDPEQTLSRMRLAVDEFAGETPQFDDLTMLCVEYKGV